MYIEIVTIPPTELPPEVPTPFRVIAVQYPSDMAGLETLMRRESALFDTPVPGMSEQMVSKMRDVRYRTAVLQLANSS